MMYLVTYHRHSRGNIVLEGETKESVQQEFLNNPHYRGCDDCGATELEPDEVVSVISLS